MTQQEYIDAINNLSGVNIPEKWTRELNSREILILAGIINYTEDKTITHSLLNYLEFFTELQIPTIKKYIRTLEKRNYIERKNGGCQIRGFEHCGTKK